MPTENPKKTQYILLGRQHATQLVSGLKTTQGYADEMTKLGFITGGADAITQEDLDFAASKTYPAGAAGTFTLVDWDAGVAAIAKNATDYSAGEDIALLKIAS